MRDGESDAEDAARLAWYDFPDASPFRQESTGKSAHTHKKSLRDTINSGLSGDPVRVSNRVWRAHFRDGNVAFRKVLSEPEEIDKEVLSSRLGRAFGARVPEVIQTGEDEVYSDFIPGKPAITFGSIENLIPYVDTPHGALIGLLDCAIGNYDRNEMNWIVCPDGIVAGIDHADVAMTPWNPFSNPRDDPIEDTGDSVFASHWFVQSLYTAGGASKDQWKENRLHPSELEDFIMATEQLRVEFNGRGHPEWCDEIIARLEAIQRHSKGSKPWLRMALAKSISNSKSSTSPATRRTSSESSRSRRMGRLYLIPA